MIPFKDSKPWVVDPEPMLTPWQSLALLFMAFLVSNVLAAIIGSEESIFILSFITEIGIYFVPPIIIAIILKYSLNNIFRWKNFLRLDLVIITFFTAIFMVIISAKILEIVQHFLPLTQEQIQWKKNLLMPAGNVPFILIFMAVAVVPGICEEILFRGVAQPAFMKKLRPAWGIILTAFLFALFHVRLQEFISLFILGIYLGLLAFRAGSFLYASLAHIIFNGTAVISAALAKSEGVQVQDGGISTPYVLAILVLFFMLMALLFMLTPRHRIGEPEMYHI